jgi:hypothetical protein
MVSSCCHNRPRASFSTLRRFSEERTALHTLSPKLVGDPNRGLRAVGTGILTWSRIEIYCKFRHRPAKIA